MKTILLSLLLLTTCTVFGQDKISPQVDLKAVGSLMSKGTPEQVKKLFGDASDELITPESHLLLYKSRVDSTQSLFRFDKSHKLYSFIFDNQKQNFSNQLLYAKAKAARSLLSRDEIYNKLGYPTQVIIKDNKETWYYKFGNKKSGEKDIIINYDILQPQVVKSYKYYADLNTSTAFTSEIVNSLTKGLSSLDDVEKKLGEPTKVIMGIDSENWYYISDQSTLIVYFNNQSKVNDYLFTKKMKE